MSYFVRWCDLILCCDTIDIVTDAPNHEVLSFFADIARLKLLESYDP